MNKLALLFALAPVFAYAQAPQAKPSTKDNVVLIQTPDSAATALKKLASVFVTQGYTIERLDKEYLTLALAPKTIASRFNPVLYARAAASNGANSVLRLSGDYKGSIGDVALGGVAQFYGSEWASSKTVFRALEKVALTYPRGQVSYGKL